MKIYITSVPVDDQEKALKFYMNVLGFEKKYDLPLGKDRWLTVTAPGDIDGVQLLLEPSGHPAIPPFKNELVKDGIPFTSFAVDDLEHECAQLEKQGVQFTQPPVDHGGYSTAVLDDTCGNLIQIIQLPKET